MAVPFPGARRVQDVSADDFAHALWLERGCFSLSPEDSGGAALTLDYRILPPEEDQYILAAKFSGAGDFPDVVIES
ncbi:MAG: hypothetical protein Q4G26_12560 [Paracoccus sp. (in: a-proteobacteria)]|nr:hypothetical protein [Paracoccus sp. (in: a-proteobacteria)]